MQHLDNIKENLAKLADIRKKNPSATHIYMRRVDKDNLVVDIPVDHAEFTIRQRPAWELVSSNQQMDDDVEALFREPAAPEAPKEEEVVVPPKPSEEVPVKRKAHAKPKRTVKRKKA
jgi:hypothetical protein